MCGIAGEVRREGRVDLAGAARVLDALATRGPDGAGLQSLAGGRVALGHRRLAILDLSEAAAQPMPNEDETVWLTFNGEIYNYRALRHELRAAGHRFRSESDSEVIVHAYEQWGDACVERLRGIFAFGIWDERRRRLLLARDPLGVKPLYLWDAPQGLAFASQPRALAAHPEFRPAVDGNALRHFLAYRYVPGELAIFEGVRKLPAGHRLVLEDGRARTERYWQLEPRPRVRDPREAESLVREKLDEAVRLQLASDVPLGLLLSGGIDSSAVGAVAADAVAQPLPSFTIGFEDERFDERPHARIAADALGCRAHEAVLTLDDALALLPTFAEVFDEPFFDHSGLATWALASLTRARGVVVALSGDGGDELFAGYRWYERFLEQPRSLWRQRLMDQIRGRARPDAVERYFGLMGYLTSAEQSALLVDAGDFDHLALFRDAWRPDLPTITALQLLDLQTFLVDDVLAKVDRASMACGVEVRVPLLDPELVEAAFSIDPQVVFADGERKALLKRAASAWLPPEVLTARKKGFSVPLAAWLDRGLRDVAHRLTLDGSLVGRGIFRADGVRDLLVKRPVDGTWLLLTAELWARRWLEGERLEELPCE